MPRHIVTPEDAGSRIDSLIARLAAASRSSVTNAIRTGCVLLNGTALTRPSTAVEADDRIEYEIPARPPLVVLPQAIPLEILYEDDALIVVDKPAGMVTHPARGSRDGTLVNALLAHVGGSLGNATLPGDTLRPGLVHRLDRDTSGLLVVAKTDESLRKLARAMERRFVRRQYLGLVIGIPDREKGTIEGPIGRDPHNRLKFAIRTDGKAAVTHFAIRERLRAHSELTFRLETGRTHQIRVHLAAYGHSIVNDPVYGRRDPHIDLPGQALHAWRLEFRHPITREQMLFESVPPAAYLRAKEALS